MYLGLEELWKITKKGITGRQRRIAQLHGWTGLRKG
jgi:hypothetical protein